MSLVIKMTNNVDWVQIGDARVRIIQRVEQRKDGKLIYPVVRGSR